jgi:hypothetical protein
VVGQSQLYDVLSLLFHQHISYSVIVKNIIYIKNYEKGQLRLGLGLRKLIDFEGKIWIG